MYKYICLPTKRCNFIIAKVEIEPPKIGAHYYYIITKYKTSGNSKKTFKSIPYTIKASAAFDTPELAIDYAKSLFPSEKERHISNYKKKIAFHSKKILDMETYDPVIRTVDCS